VTILSCLGLSVKTGKEKTETPPIYFEFGSKTAYQVLIHIAGEGRNANFFFFLSFCSGAAEDYVLLGYGAVLLCNPSPTFRDIVAASTS